MQITLVINSKKYSYHKNMVALFQEILAKYADCRLFDMADNMPLHEKYYAIAGSECDFLISFDCAGFELRTEGDSLSYNNMGCRMAHILFQGMHEYREELKQQMNFSMFVFSMKEEDVLTMQEKHPNIPNAELMERLEYKETTAGEKNREIVEKWFAHMIEEAELDCI